MKILMVSSEAAPFAKTGGLADAVSALSKTLTQAGNEVKVLIPRYYGIDRTGLSLVHKDVSINTGWQDISADFYKKDIFYFVDYEPLFGRDGIYSQNGTDFQDNPLRFSVLARAAFALCRTENWTPDVIHCHDWAACLVPVLYRFSEHHNFPGAKTVLSIHNLGYQGIFGGWQFDDLGLPEKVRKLSGLESGYDINFLKAGITCSDIISTVSETYAQEIQTAEQGFGLDELLRIRKSTLKGIVNGADLTEWNPAADRYIPANYSASDLSGKAICKKELQKKFGLEENPDIPVIGIVSRLAAQKGIQELFSPKNGCISRILKELKVQFAVVGSGEKWCQEEIKKLSAQFPNFKCFVGYSENLSHLVEAGSDFFLMPSRYEPCGLNQIYSMLYGTLPVVHKTGGLADTVENYSPESKTCTGFTFDLLSPEAIFKTVEWALQTWQNKSAVKKMQQNGMTKDFSWNNSAQKYLELYKK